MIRGRDERAGNNFIESISMMSKIARMRAALIRVNAGGSRIKIPFPILIADENPATLEFLSRLLEDNGFSVAIATSGEAAWELRLQHQFCAVLIGDLMKPPVDGIDLIRRLRSSHLPIILATSYGADYMLLARLAGARVVIHKFVDPLYLISTIKQNIHPDLVLF
jgi:CheY-like chemotaxis protein